jgi:hypothetical protein
MFSTFLGIVLIDQLRLDDLSIDDLEFFIDISAIVAFFE